MPWSELRDAKPKREEETGVGGDRVPSDLVFCRMLGQENEGRGACPTPKWFFFFFFLYHVFVVKVQELACSASYGVNKTILLAPGKKPSTQVPLVWNQPHTSHIK